MFSFFKRDDSRLEAMLEERFSEMEKRCCKPVEDMADSLRAGLEPLRDCPDGQKQNRRELRRMQMALGTLLEQQEIQSRAIARMESREPALKALLAFAEAWTLERQAKSEVSDEDRILDAKFRELLQAFDLRVIDTLLVPFDPAVHEICDVVSDPSRPDGCVTQIVRPGFMLGSKLLQNAVVVVNRPDPGDGSSSPDPSSEVRGAAVLEAPLDKETTD